MGWTGIRIELGEHEKTAEINEAGFAIRPFLSADQVAAVYLNDNHKRMCSGAAQFAPSQAKDWFTSDLEGGLTGGYIPGKD